MYPVNKPSITDKDIDAVSATMVGGWLSGDGPVVQEFEFKFSELAERKYAVAVCNGSVALELAFEALNLPVGSEVILPTFAIISCLAPILRQNLVPVFVDADLFTWNVDLKKLYECISPATKAILVVHTYGLGLQLDELEIFCKKNSIYLIEDAAEAHGVIIDGRRAGSFGDVSTFSFYANKLITTGEGGMILTNNKEISVRLNSLRNLGFKKELRFVHDELGHNYRLSSLQASLGISQISRIQDAVNRHIQIANIYKKHLLFQNLYSFQPAKNKSSTNVYWVVGILLCEKMKDYKLDLVNRLEAMGVQTRPFFYPLHRQPLLGNYSIDLNQSLPNSENLYDSGFYLPTGNGYIDREIIEISTIFNRVMSELVQEKNIV
jgi:perosamine synthetase